MGRRYEGGSEEPDPHVMVSPFGDGEVEADSLQEPDRWWRIQAADPSRKDPTSRAFPAATSANQSGTKISKVPRCSCSSTASVTTWTGSASMPATSGSLS